MEVHACHLSHEQPNLPPDYAPMSDSYVDSARRMNRTEVWIN